jgi:hypothetical protein
LIGRLIGFCQGYCSKGINEKQAICVIAFRPGVVYDNIKNKNRNQENI